MADDVPSPPGAPAAPVRHEVVLAPSSPEADFDRFCRDEYAAVTGLAFVLTGRWSVAEDLAQDAFFAAFRRWDQLGGYDKPGAWVRRVVANRAVSWRRRLRSEAAALTRLGARPGGDADDGAIPLRDAAVWAAVRRLPPRQAQVFALTYVEDLALDRVAEILGISRDTAKTHLRRARATLTEEARRRPAAIETTTGTTTDDGHDGRHEHDGRDERGERP